MPYQWVWLGQLMQTKPEVNCRGARSPVCKAYDAVPPRGEFLYQYGFEEVFGPVKGIYGDAGHGYLTVLVPHKDGAGYPDVFVNVSKWDQRFAVAYRGGR